MTNVLILGASGAIARHVVASLHGDGAIEATLFLRNKAKRAGQDNTSGMRIVEGDATDATALTNAMTGQEIVYANLTGEDLDDQAKAIIAAMKKTGIKRLIFVLSLGIYDEVPGKFGTWNRKTIGEDLKPFRRAADAIETSGLDYTIIRPAWLTDDDEISYELTGRQEPFKGTVVSRRSVADLVTKILHRPSLHSGGNLGVNQPDTDGDKPYFM